MAVSRKEKWLPHDSKSDLPLHYFLQMKIKDAQLGHDHNQNKDETKEKRFMRATETKNKQTKPRLLDTNLFDECLR